MNLVSNSILFIAISLVSSGNNEATKENLFSLEHLNNILTKIVDSQSSEVSRDKKDNVFSNVQEIIKISSKQNEGWQTFAKRIASFLLGHQSNALEEQLNIDLAKTIYEKSPQIVRDLLQYKMSGRIAPIIENRLAEIGRSMKQAENISEEVESKTPSTSKTVDPFVVGVNGLINMGWATAFILGMGPNMGLENLFSPNYDFDYDDYEKEYKAKKVARQKEQELEICMKHRNKARCKKILEQAAKEAAEQPVLMSPEQFFPSQMNVQSSYVHYPGQNFEYPQKDDPTGYYVFQVAQNKDST